MTFRALDAWLPTDFPERLASGDRQVAGLRPRPLVLLGLVLLCLIPRTVMAWKVTSLCPDGVFYLRLADHLEHRQFAEALATIRLNLFPIILMLLARVGVPMELGGMLWNVVLSSCVVLPLFGWVRRLCDDRVAVAACFLYAVHPGLIRWSAEVIRDPTFWFLLSLSLYLLWRGITEVRWPLMLAGGLSTALACLTRFEGCVLLVPLVVWSFWRGWARAELRGRVILGAVLSMAIYPLLLLLFSTFWVGGKPAELVHSHPIELAGRWISEASLPSRGNAAASAALDASVPPPMGWAKSVERFAEGMIKGMTPLFLACGLAGLAGAWSTWKRPDYQPLFCASLIILLAIWIHMRWSEEAGQRYFYTLVLMTCPLAAIGLLRVSAACRGWAPGGRRAALAAAAPAIIVLAAGWSIGLGSDYRFRTATVQVARWSNGQFGQSPLVFGPKGVTQVVNYYAGGRCESFAESAADTAIVADVARLQPDIVLLPSIRETPGGAARLAGRIEALGFTEVERSKFAGGCAKLLILRRRAMDCKS